MGKLKALLLTQGMHGMISQVEGLAKALNAEYSHKIVRLSFPWNLIPPNITKSPPAPNPFATSPGQVQPPSAMI